MEADPKCYRKIRAKNGEAEMHWTAIQARLRQGIKRGKRAYTKMHTPAGAHACAHAHIRLRIASCSLHKEAE